MVLEAYLLELFCIAEREMLFTDASSFFLLVSEVAGNYAGASSSNSRKLSQSPIGRMSHAHVLCEFKK